MMESIMPIITGIVDGQVVYLYAALAIGVILLISLLILQKRTSTGKKSQEKKRVTIEGLFPDVVLQNAIAKNLGVVINEPIHQDDLGQLQKLVVEYAGVTDLRGIAQLKNLEEVSFSNNKITNIPEEFGTLEKLRRINFAYNNLEDVTPLSKNTHLKSVDVSGNKLTNTIDALYTLPELEELMLINTDQSDISSKIADAKKLKRLNVSYNNLTNIPTEVSQLTALEVLNVGNNQLTSLPEELASLQEIAELDLTGNIFASIPENIQSMLKAKDIAIPMIVEEPIVTEIIPEPVFADNVITLNPNSEKANLPPINKFGTGILEKGHFMNTFIDLTSNNDTLLAELEALEIIEPKETPIIEMVEENKTVQTGIVDDITTGEAVIDIVSEVKEGADDMFSKVEKEVSNAMETIENKVVDTAGKLEDKLSEVHISEQSITTPITPEEALTKKQKIKKIVAIGAGVLLAIGAVAGGAYVYTKAEEQKKTKKIKGIFTR